MNWFNTLQNNQRFVFSLTALLVALGILSYGTMSRQEDPSFPYRFGLIQAVFPGATAHQIKQLITEPLEEELAQVELFKSVKSVSRDNVAIVNVILNDSVYKTDDAWDKVRRAIERANKILPDGAQDITLDDRVMDIPSVVLSVTGSNDPILLADTADKIKQRLLSVAGVSRIEIRGAPKKELVIRTDDAQLNQLGLNRQAISTVIQQKNLLIPGGLINLGDQYIRLNTASDLNSINEFNQIPIQLANGQTIPLGALADISIEAKSPSASQTYHDTERAVTLGIITERGQTDAVAFGKAMRAKIIEFDRDFYPLHIKETFFQPDYVSGRLDQLKTSLLISAAIIAFVVCLALGWRTGILVSIVLPVVALITLALYNLGGGIMHQIAIIGIVISLGILVDNAIVVVEAIQAKMRAGLNQFDAAKDAASQLAMPLFSSTGTTVAAFLPLLLSKGGTGDFTRAIPIMIIIALITSYALSIFVLPLIARYTLTKKTTGTAHLLTPLSSKINRVLANHPRAPLFIVVLMFCITALIAPLLKMSFFPAADRSQVVVDLQLAGGTSLEKTQQVSANIEAQLKQRSDVVSVMRSVGMSGFRFYYNLAPVPNSPNFARLMVNTTSGAANDAILDWFENTIQTQFPEALIIAKKLGQGPPIPAPVLLRLQSDDPNALFQASQLGLKILHETPGTRMIRSDLDQGMPELSVDINDYATESLGLNRSAVAAEIFAQTGGLNSGSFRYSNNPIDIKVRSSLGEYTAPSSIQSFPIYNAEQAIPLDSIATVTTRWSAAEIRHYNFQPSVTLLSELQPGAAFNQVLDNFFKQLEIHPLPDGVSVSVGGEAEGSQDANQAILRTAPIGIFFLLLFMMMQFNSFRRIGIILTTIPLAALGILPGLVISGEPFGFQSVLGIVALIGIVVNNAIVLIDLIDRELKLGKSIEASVATAIEQRTTPIILTTATTILGLLPLALSQSTLWPPMAWAIISGLAMSTVLTLFVIPCLCLLLLKNASAQTTQTPSSDARNPNPKLNPSVLSSILMIGVLATLTTAPTNRAYAQSLSLPDTLRAVQNNRSLAAQRLATDAVEMQLSSSKRQAFLPKLKFQGAKSWQHDQGQITLPTGNLVVSEKNHYVVESSIEQPLFTLSGQKYAVAAARNDLFAAQFAADNTQIDLSHAAAQRYIAVLKIKNGLEAQRQLKSALEARESQTNSQFKEGLRLHSDVLQVTVAKNNSLSSIAELEQRLRIELLKLNQITQLDVTSMHHVSTLEDELHTLINRSGIKEALENKESAFSTVESPIELASCNQHPRCAGMLATVDGLSERMQAVSSTRLPEFNLALQNTRSNGLTFVEQSENKLALNMSWQPFSGGAISKQKKQLASQRQAMLMQLAELAQSIAIEKEQAKANWQVAVAHQELAQSSLAASKERIRIITQRYEQGLHTLDDVLDAEAALTRDQAQAKNSKLDLLGAAADWLRATGQGFDQWTWEQ